MTMNCWILVVVLCVLGTGSVLADLSIDRIAKCVENRVGKVSKTKSPSSRELFLYFGDAGIEAMSVFDGADIKRIKALSKCVERDGDFLFEDRTHSTHHLYDGGSNVTYLTGIFQTVCSDLDTKLRVVAQKAIQRANWKGQISTLGIRSAQYLSFWKPGLKDHKEALRQEALEKQRGKAFIVYPDAESKRQQAEREKQERLSRFDPDSDESVLIHLLPPERDPRAVTFTAIVPLNDRSEFAGGDILVTKYSHTGTESFASSLGESAPPTVSSSSDRLDTDEEREDDEYNDAEDDDESEEEETDDEDTHSQHSVRKTVGASAKQLESHFDAERHKISRFTPEKGSLLLIQQEEGRHARGMRPILFGKRQILLIEFWAFQDARVGLKRPSIHDAIPMKANEEL